MATPPPTSASALDMGLPHRQQQYQQLVQRFEAQLLHGCTCAECTTPMCSSGRRHLQRQKPFRAHTPLSARILAHHLAAEPSPAKYLCPHPPKEAPDGPAPTLVPTDPRSLSQAIFSRLSIQTASSAPDTAKLPVDDGDLDDFLTGARLKALLKDKRDFDNEASLHCARRSLGACLSDVERLLKSFKTDGRLESHLELCDAFGRSHAVESLVFDSLWIAAGTLFDPPPALSSSTPLAETCANGHGDAPFLSNKEAAHVALLCLYALISPMLPPAGFHVDPDRRGFAHRCCLNASLPVPRHNGPVPGGMNIAFHLSSQPVLRLARRLFRGVRARASFDEIYTELVSPDTHPSTFLAALFGRLESVDSILSDEKIAGGLGMCYSLVELLWCVIFDSWDGDALVDENNSVGASVWLLKEIVRPERRMKIGGSCSSRYLGRHVDRKKEIQRFLWHTSDPSPGVFHLYEHPWLFSDHYLVECFRAANLARMLAQHQRRETLNEQYREIVPSLGLLVPDTVTGMLGNQLLLFVRREHILEDTLNQLRRTNRASLLLPLKVKIGGDTGEIGQDEGGVSYEFFQLVLGEVLNSDSMFTVSQENTIWFKPGSPEPPWMFEMIGLIFSLAVYNGITLPACPPLWFFKSLLNANTGKDYFWHSDAIEFDPWWYELTKNVEGLRSKEGDDVAKQGVFYAFTLATGPGLAKDVDLKAFFSQYSDCRENWPVDTLREIAERVLDQDLPFFEEGQGCPYVTAADRDDFICQYKLWASCISVLPQFVAFLSGFEACLSPHVLGLLNPRQMRSLIIGLPDIDATQLKLHTMYGNPIDKDTIALFWSVVEEYNIDELRMLLKFVTACERVPVGGYPALGFTIHTVAVDTERFPTSSTCARALSLPRYPTKEMMREKLSMAIRMGQGFGLS